jgi:hypothetical protein
MPTHLLETFRRWLAPASMLVVLTWTLPAMSAMNGYTDRAAFNAASADRPVVVTDFESFAVGTVFAPGSGPAGSGFVLESSASGAFGEDPMVSDAFWATSGVNFLGASNGDSQFFSGDSLTFTFAGPTAGFGLYVIGGSDVLAGDIRLSAGGADVLNVDDASKLSDGNGSFAFFLGLASDNGATFGSATLTGIDPGNGAFFVFAVDDVVVTSPVPEPPMAVMLALGLSGVLAWRVRRSS